MPKTIFYARVSTRDQNLNAQVDAARRLGIDPEHIFVEKASGARHDRPVLGKALASLDKGDTLLGALRHLVRRDLMQMTAFAPVSVVFLSRLN